MNFKNITAGITALAVVVGCTYPSFAQKPFLDKVRKAYSLDNKNGKCDLCHEIKPKEEPSAKNLNKYGKAINEDPSFKPLQGKDEKYKFSDAELATVLKIVNSLDDKDSDG